MKNSMSDEQPVIIKKQKFDGDIFDPVNNFFCVVHFDQYTGNDTIKPLSHINIQSITKAAQIRQMQTSRAARMDDICANIPVTLDTAKHGCHRWCYSKFTCTTSQTAQHSLPAAAGAISHLRKRSSSASRDPVCSRLFPQNCCLFCHKGPSKQASGAGQKGPLTKCVTLVAEKTIKDAAVRKNDFELLGLIADESMVAREARYHESCRSTYVRKPKSSCSNTEDLESLGSSEAKRIACEDAFQFICSYVDENIIAHGTVERVTMLQNRYLSYLDEKSPNFYNHGYQTHQLKDKLVKHFGNKLRFYNPGSKGQLVYSAQLDIGEAIAAAFDALTAESKVLSDAAMILRNRIKLAHFKATNRESTWPPSSTFIEEQRTTDLPEALKSFMSMVSQNKSFEKASTKVLRLSLSFTEDLCAAVTRGEWKMGKQLFLGYTLHHLTGREDLVTLLNRFGHCVSYSSLLELETAIANCETRFCLQTFRLRTTKLHILYGITLI
jgi:hypothetical protein